MFHFSSRLEVTFEVLYQSFIGVTLLHSIWLRVTFVAEKSTQGLNEMSIHVSWINVWWGHLRCGLFVCDLSVRNGTAQKSTHLAGRPCLLCFCLLDGWRLGCGHSTERSCLFGSLGVESKNSSQCTLLSLFCSSYVLLAYVQSFLWLVISLGVRYYSDTLIPDIFLWFLLYLWYSSAKEQSLKMCFIAHKLPFTFFEK